MNWGKVWTAQNWERLLVGDLLTKGEAGGLLLTLEIGLLAIVISTVVGAVIGVMRSSRLAAVRVPALVYVEILRNIPLLILVFWAYFVPPQLGWETSKFEAVLIALCLLASAYLAEIVRGGIRSVPQDNIEGARALGLSRLQILTRIVLPQAFYNMIPAIAGRYIVIIKNTSLAFLIGLADLTDIGKQISARLMTSPVEIYLTLIILYFIVNASISALMRKLETRPTFNSLFVRL